MLGLLSLIFWTLTIIPLLKYVFVVLRADDHGEGGTFALHSYLCRHINFKIKLTIQSTRLESDASMKYYTRGSALKSNYKNFIEKSEIAQNFLTFFVLLGTAMVIGDDALAPATSVLSRSALAWIQSLSRSAPALTTGCCTSKGGFSFSPIMFLWFISNILIGVYNFVTYNPIVLKALSPYYIIKFFKGQGISGWELLGAVFLCTHKV